MLNVRDRSITQYALIQDGGEVGTARSECGAYARFYQGGGSGRCRDGCVFGVVCQRLYFKCIQAPPIIVLSKSAVGFDLRETHTLAYTPRIYAQLKEKVLGK